MLKVDEVVDDVVNVVDDVVNVVDDVRTYVLNVVVLYYCCFK